jgi:hypothetical protein
MIIIKQVRPNFCHYLGASAQRENGLLAYMEAGGRRGGGGQAPLPASFPAVEPHFHFNWDPLGKGLGDREGMPSLGGEVTLTLFLVLVGMGGGGGDRVSSFFPRGRCRKRGKNKNVVIFCFLLSQKKFNIRFYSVQSVLLYLKQSYLCSTQK